MPTVHFNATIKGGLPVYVEAIVSTWNHDGGGAAVEDMRVYWQQSLKAVPDHIVNASDQLMLDEQAIEASQ